MSNEKDGLKIGVIGSRNFPRLELVKQVVMGFTGDDVLVSGGAKGVDKTAEDYADKIKIKKEIYKPDFSLGYNPKQYHIRNKEIIENSDVVIIFWDKKSKGTLSSLKIINEKDVGSATIQEERKRAKNIFVDWFHSIKHNAGNFVDAIDGKIVIEVWKPRIKKKLEKISNE